MTTPSPSETLRRRQVPSPVGALTLVASPCGLRAVLWPDDRPGRVPLPDDDTADAPDTTEAVAAERVLDAAEEQLAAWFAGARTAFDLPLDPVGTPFQRQVWDALGTIPFGATTTYAELAARTGDRRRARAVGGAVGRNPLSVVVPCHRVVGADGSLTGFAGGMEAKRTLLAHEAGEAPLPL